MQTNWVNIGKQNKNNNKLVQFNTHIHKWSNSVSWWDIGWVIDEQTDLKNILDNKADLVGGKVPASQLPSYVDDVLEFADFASLPVTGEAWKIYVTTDTNNTYRWTWTTYVQIGWGGTFNPVSTDSNNIITNGVDGMALFAVAPTYSPINKNQQIIAKRLVQWWVMPDFTQMTGNKLLTVWYGTAIAAPFEQDVRNDIITVDDYSNWLNWVLYTRFTNWELHDLYTVKLWKDILWRDILYLTNSDINPLNPTATGWPNNELNQNIQINIASQIVWGWATAYEFIPSQTVYDSDDDNDSDGIQWYLYTLFEIEEYSLYTFNHNHDELYYTKAQVDTLLSSVTISKTNNQIRLNETWDEVILSERPTEDIAVFKNRVIQYKDIDYEITWGVTVTFFTPYVDADILVLPYTY